jgi:hypothetical protein
MIAELLVVVAACAGGACGAFAYDQWIRPLLRRAPERALLDSPYRSAPDIRRPFGLPVLPAPAATKPQLCPECKYYEKHRVNWRPDGVSGPFCHARGIFHPAAEANPNGDCTFYKGN